MDNLQSFPVASYLHEGPHPERWGALQLWDIIMLLQVWRFENIPVQQAGLEGRLESWKCLHLVLAVEQLSSIPAVELLKRVYVVVPQLLSQIMLLGTGQRGVQRRQTPQSHQLVAKTRGGVLGDGTSGLTAAASPRESRGIGLVIVVAVWVVLGVIVGDHLVVVPPG